jgi:hypothetical protein
MRCEFVFLTKVHELRYRSELPHLRVSRGTQSRPEKLAHERGEGSVLQTRRACAPLSPVEPV